MKLFVYGTLMRGECRAHALSGRPGVSFLGEATVRGRLFAIDGEDYPALRCGPDDDDRVRGELFEFDDPALLSRIDAIEDFFAPGDPRNLYERIELPVRLDGDARAVSAWTYVMSDAAERGHPIVSASWREYGE